MEALNELRHVYGLARTVIGGALILMALVLLMALFATPVRG
jgi:hypothetical protein